MPRQKSALRLLLGKLYLQFAFEQLEEEKSLGFHSSQPFAIIFFNRYLGASFDVPSLVEKLLHQLASKHTIVVNLYDTTNVSAPIRMYGPDTAASGEMHISYVDFGDPTRKHEMHCRYPSLSKNLAYADKIENLFFPYM